MGKTDEVRQFPVLRQAVNEGRVQVFFVQDLVEGDFEQVLEGIDAVSLVGFPIL